MTREIKFRAWIRGKMEYSFTPVGLGMLLIDRKPEIAIMQYTGLKDKNGKEVYEGDVVKGIVKRPQLLTWDTDENCNTKMGGEVYYDYCGFSLKVIESLCDPERDGMVNYFEFVSLEDGDFNEMEVIGNIYSNPELLSTT